MPDVERDTKVTPEDPDFEGHKQKLANDEPDSDSDPDFEGHKQKLANDEPDSDSDPDFEGHKQKLANDEPDSDWAPDFEGHKNRSFKQEQRTGFRYPAHSVGHEPRVDTRALGLAPFRGRSGHEAALRVEL